MTMSYLKIINGHVQITCVAAIAPRCRCVRFSRVTSNSASYRSYERAQLVRVPVRVADGVEDVLHEKVLCKSNKMETPAATK